MLPEHHPLQLAKRCATIDRLSGGRLFLVVGLLTGVLLGTAWAVVYTATPMLMSEMVTDEHGLAASIGTENAPFGLGEASIRAFRPWRGAG